MPSPRTSLAGTHSGRRPGRAGPRDQVGVLGVGGVEPGEADERADLAEPLGLHDVVEERLEPRAGTGPVEGRSPRGSGQAGWVKISHSGPAGRSRRRRPLVAPAGAAGPPIAAQSSSSAPAPQFGEGHCLRERQHFPRRDRLELLPEPVDHRVQLDVPRSSARPG